MNEFAAKTLETRSAYYYLKGTNNLALYKKYMQGKMTRGELMKNIPASIIKTIINYQPHSNFRNTGENMHVRIKKY